MIDAKAAPLGYHAHCGPSIHQKPLSLHDAFPSITYLEETYYQRLNPRDGFAIQRAYTDDRQLDETMAIKDRDFTLVAHGHLPCRASYGFEFYYLNVMAGPRRNWRFVPAPEVDWIGLPPDRWSSQRQALEPF